MLTAIALLSLAPAADPLACAADRYRAAARAERTVTPAQVVAAKGMGAIAPADPSRRKARQLRAEGDAYRAQAGSDLSPAQIVAAHSDRRCG